jgi:hypothetical protein
MMRLNANEVNRSSCRNAKDKRRIGHTAGVLASFVIPGNHCSKIMDDILMTFLTRFRKLRVRPYLWKELSWCAWSLLPSKLWMP